MLKNCFVLTKEEKELLGLLEIYSPDDYDIKDLPYQYIKETGSFMTLYIYDNLISKIRLDKDNIVSYLRKNPDRLSFDNKTLEEVIFGKNVKVIPIKQEIHVPDNTILKLLSKSHRVMNDKIIMRLFNNLLNKDVFHSDIKSLLEKPKKIKQRRKPVRPRIIFFVFFIPEIKKTIDWYDTFP